MVTIRSFLRYLGELWAIRSTRAYAEWMDRDMARTREGLR